MSIRREMPLGGCQTAQRRFSATFWNMDCGRRSWDCSIRGTPRLWRAGSQRSSTTFPITA